MSHEVTVMPSASRIFGRISFDAGTSLRKTLDEAIAEGLDALEVRLGWWDGKAAR